MIKKKKFYFKMINIHKVQTCRMPVTLLFKQPRKWILSEKNVQMGNISLAWRLKHLKSVWQQSHYTKSFKTFYKVLKLFDCPKIMTRTQQPKTRFWSPFNSRGSSFFLNIEISRVTNHICIRYYICDGYQRSSSKCLLNILYLTFELILINQDSNMRLLDKRVVSMLNR